MRSLELSPNFLRKFHLVMTVVWGILIPVTLVWLRQSILWIALMSVYANFVGHFGSWQASRAEVAVVEADIDVNVQNN